MCHLRLHNLFKFLRNQTLNVPRWPEIALQVSLSADFIGWVTYKLEARQNAVVSGTSRCISVIQKIIAL
jgi:hypothetical protein